MLRIRLSTPPLDDFLLVLTFFGAESVEAFGFLDFEAESDDLLLAWLPPACVGRAGGATRGLADRDGAMVEAGADTVDGVGARIPSRAGSIAIAAG